MDEKSEIVVDARVESSLPDTTNHIARDLDHALWYVQQSSIGNDA